MEYRASEELYRGVWTENPLLTMSLGFMLALVPLSALREVVGAHTVWGIPVLPSVEPVRFVVLAPGGFLILGLTIALVNVVRMRKEGRTA